MRLSVVMPAYNEEGVIEEAVREVQACVLSLVADSELLVVNDGSLDRTGEILEVLAKRDNHLHVIHQKNRGHGRALRTGLEAATGEYLFLIDSDRQIPLNVFGALWDAAQNHDGVFGVRKRRVDPKLRLLLTRIVRGVLRILIGVRLTDANAPCKVVKRKVWLEAQKYIPENTLAPSIFLAVYMRRNKSVLEFSVPHLPRTTGLISIRRWKLFKFCVQAFGQLLIYRWRLRNVR